MRRRQAVLFYFFGRSVAEVRTIGGVQGVLAYLDGKFLVCINHV